MFLFLRLILASLLPNFHDLCWLQKRNADDLKHTFSKMSTLAANDMLIRR